MGVPADDPTFLFRILSKMDSDASFKREIHKRCMSGDLEWIYSTPQLKIRRALLEFDESLTLASRRIGKSFVSLGTSIEYNIKNPKSVSRIFSSTLKNCQDIVNDNMVIFMQLFPDEFIKRVSSLYRWKFPYLGSEIRIHPLEKGSADNSRGGSCDFAIIEEASFIDEDYLVDALDSVIMPMFLRKDEEKICFVTTAARSDDHWVHRVLEPRCKEKGSLFYASIYDNPHLSASRIAKIQKKMTTEAWHREMLCVPYTDKSRSVIPEFNPDVHVKKLDRPPFIRPLTVLDFGGVRDKHGIVHGYYNPHKRVKYVEGSALYNTHTHTQEIVRRVHKAEEELFGGKLNTRCADAAGQIIVDLNNMEFSTYPPQKRQGSWESGISDLREALIRGQLLISPDCVELIACLKAAIYNKKRTDWERTERHGHFDLLAALIYFNNEVSLSDAYPVNWGVNQENQYIPRSRKRTRQNELSLDMLIGEI